MNTKGQQSVFTIVFLVIIFVLLLGGGLGKIVQDMVSVSSDFATQGGASGIELFLLGNLLLWIVVGFIIAIMWWSR